MTTPRIEEMVEEKLEKMFEVKNGFFSSGDYTTKRFAVWEIRQALTEAYQAGIDEAVEVVKKQRNTDSCIGISGLHHAEEKRVYNQAPDDTIKALQDNK